MLVRRIHSPGLGHDSYYVASGDDAIVIDPRRDVDVYLDLLAEAGHRLCAIVETHCHEDFVSGATALQSVTGVAIRRSERAPGPGVEPTGDGDKFAVGDLRLRVLETPGHTEDSLCFSLIDVATSHAPVMVFTGDTTLVAGTGRVDLEHDRTTREMAEKLHDSFLDKLIRLGDGVIVAAAHTGRTLAGLGHPTRHHTTIGYERLYTFMPRYATRGEFVAAKLDEGLPTPPHMARARRLNLDGTAPLLDRDLAPTPLAPGEVGERNDAGAVVLDVRARDDVAEGHIPGSVAISADLLAQQLSHHVQSDTTIVLVVGEDRDAEPTARLLWRLGYDHLAGYLAGGIDAWRREGRSLDRPHLAGPTSCPPVSSRRRFKRSRPLGPIEAHPPSGRCRHPRPHPSPAPE